MIPRKLTHGEISEIVSKVDYLLGTQGEIRNKINIKPKIRKLRSKIIKEVRRIPEKRIIKVYDQYMEKMNFFKYLKKALYDKLSYIDLVPVSGARDEFAQVIFESINNSWINPGEHVGAIAVDAIFQQYTQATLNTFHKTGSLYKIGSGVDRLIEILSAKKEPKFASISTYFTHDYTYEELIKFRRYDLRQLTFGNLITDFFMETSDLYFGTENDKIDYPKWYIKYMMIVEDGNSLYKNLEGVFLRFIIDPYLIYLNRIDLKSIVKKLNETEGTISLFSPILKIDGNFVIYFDIYPNKKNIKIDKVREKVKYKFKPKKYKDSIKEWKERVETLTVHLQKLNINQQEEIETLTEEISTYNANIENINDQLEKYSSIQNIFDNNSIYSVYLQTVVSENVKNLPIRGIDGLTGVYPQDISIEIVFQQVVLYKDNFWMLSLSRPIMKRKGVSFDRIINVLKIMNLNPILISDPDKLYQEDYIPQPDDIDDEDINYPDAFVIFENNFVPENVQMFFDTSNYNYFNIVENLHDSVMSFMLNDERIDDPDLQMDDVPNDKPSRYFKIIFNIVENYIKELQEKPISNELIESIYKKSGLDTGIINFEKIVNVLTELLHDMYIDEYKVFKEIIDEKFNKIRDEPDQVEEIDEIVLNFVTIYNIDIQRYLILPKELDINYHGDLLSKIEEDLLLNIDSSNFIELKMFEYMYNMITSQLQGYFDIFQYNIFIGKMRALLNKMINEWKEQSNIEFDIFYQLSAHLFIKKYKTHVFSSKLDVINFNINQQITGNNEYLFVKINDKEHSLELIDDYDFTYFKYKTEYVFKIYKNEDLSDILNAFKFKENFELIDVKKIIKKYFQEDNIINEQNVIDAKGIPKMTNFHRKTHVTFADIDGCNIKELFEELDIDRTQTYTNNMWKMLKMFGIDVVRNLIITELVEIGESNGLYIDPRYLAIIADTMTQNGNIRNLNYTTMKKYIGSYLEAAGEQQPIKMLIAAVGAPTQQLRGGFEFTGTIPPVGTGVFENLEHQEAIEELIKRGIGIPTKRYIDNDLENILTGDSYASLYEVASKTEIIKKLVTNGEDDGTSIYDLLDDKTMRENIEMLNDILESTIITLNEPNEFVNETMGNMNLTGEQNIDPEQIGDEFTIEKDDALFISPQQLTQMAQEGVTQEHNLYIDPDEFDDFDFDF